MAEGIFNEQMTRSQARTVLFAAVDGKTKDEIEKLKSEYLKVLPAITERENELIAEGWLIS